MKDLKTSSAALLHVTCCLQKQEIVTGLQSVPVYKLPLMLSAARKFSFDNAFLDFSLADHNTRAAAEAQAASRSLCCFEAGQHQLWKPGQPAAKGLLLLATPTSF